MREHSRYGFTFEFKFLEFIQNQQMILKEENACHGMYFTIFHDMICIFIYYLCVSNIPTLQVNVQSKFYQVEIL
jgi:hypothetical protein